MDTLRENPASLHSFCKNARSDSALCDASFNGGSKSASHTSFNLLSFAFSVAIALSVVVFHDLSFFFSRKSVLPIIATPLILTTSGRLLPSNSSISNLPIGNVNCSSPNFSHATVLIATSSNDPFTGYQSPTHRRPLSSSEIATSSTVPERLSVKVTSRRYLLISSVMSFDSLLPQCW